MIDEQLKEIGKKRGERIFMNDLQLLLDKLNKTAFLEQFQDGKSASNLAIEVKNIIIIIIILNIF